MPGNISSVFRRFTLVSREVNGIFSVSSERSVSIPFVSFSTLSVRSQFKFRPINIKKMGENFCQEFLQLTHSVSKLKIQWKHNVHCCVETATVTLYPTLQPYDTRSVFFCLYNNVCVNAYLNFLFCEYVYVLTRIYFSGGPLRNRRTASSSLAYPSFFCKNITKTRNRVKRRECY